jgi:hypothetical protein
MTIRRWMMVVAFAAGLCALPLSLIGPSPSILALDAGVGLMSMIYPWFVLVVVASCASLPSVHDSPYYHFFMNSCLVASCVGTVAGLIVRFLRWMAKSISRSRHSRPAATDPAPPAEPVASEALLTPELSVPIGGPAR